MKNKKVKSTASPSVDDNNNMNPNNKCRSLVCDSSGIIIAEMVYRCMICYSVTDSINEAKDHYSMVHMQEEEEEEDEEKATPSVDNIFSSSPSRHFSRTSLVPDLNRFEENVKFANTSHHLNNSLRQLNNLKPGRKSPDILGSILLFNIYFA